MASKYDAYWAEKAELLADLVSELDQARSSRQVHLIDLGRLGELGQGPGTAVMAGGRIEHADGVNLRALARWLLDHHGERMRQGTYGVRLTQHDLHIERLDGETAALYRTLADDNAPNLQSPTCRPPAPSGLGDPALRSELAGAEDLPALERVLDRLAASAERPTEARNETLAFLADLPGAYGGLPSDGAPNEKASGGVDPDAAPEVTSDAAVASDQDDEPSLVSEPFVRPDDIVAPSGPARTRPAPRAPCRVPTTLPDPHRMMSPPFDKQTMAWLDRASGPIRRAPDPTLLPPFDAETEARLTATTPSNETAEPTPPEPEPASSPHDPLTSLVGLLHRMVDVLPLVRPPFEVDRLPTDAVYLFHEGGRRFGYDGREHPRITRIGAPRRFAQTRSREDEAARDAAIEEVELAWDEGEDAAWGPEEVLVARAPVATPPEHSDATVRLEQGWAFRVLPVADDAERAALTTFLIATLSTFKAQEAGAEVDTDAFLAAFSVEPHTRQLLGAVRAAVDACLPQTPAADGEHPEQKEADEAKEDLHADLPRPREDGRVVIPLDRGET